MSGQIKSMTAQGMTQGFIMCLMPLGHDAVFSFIDEYYVDPSSPRRWAGSSWPSSFILDVVGLWLMLKLVKVEV